MIRAITAYFLINFIATTGWALSCGRPQVPKYTRIYDDTHQYANGSTVAYYCSPDTILVDGSRITTCDNGVWRGRVPVCATYNRNITLISVTRKSNYSDYYDTEIASHQSSSCDETHPTFSWQMIGAESFAFNLSEQQTAYKFILIKLVVTSLNRVSMSENLLKSVISPSYDERGSVSMDETCDIYAEGDNEFSVLCVFVTHTKSVPTLFIEPSDQRIPINITLLKFEIGFVKQECGDPEKPVGASVKINGNAAVSECDNNRNSIEYSCDNGVWSSDDRLLVCESQSKPVIDPIVVRGDSLSNEVNDIFRR